MMAQRTPRNAVGLQKEELQNQVVLQAELHQ
jgi:hypothetical protein